MEHYTQEEAVAILEDRATSDDNLLSHGCEIGHDTLHAIINAAVTRKLAEKELEIVRLREALETLKNVVIEQNCRGTDWGDLFGNLMTALSTANVALSTPSSTKALDEYVAEFKKDAERYRVARKLVGNMAPYEVDEKCDAAIAAEGEKKC